MLLCVISVIFCKLQSEFQLLRCPHEINNTPVSLFILFLFVLASTTKPIGERRPIHVVCQLGIELGTSRFAVYLEIDRYRGLTIKLFLSGLLAYPERAMETRTLSDKSHYKLM